MDGRRILFVAGGAFIALILGLTIYALIPRATLVLSVAPEEMTLVINGASESVTTGQEITVSPGSITLELRRDEFDSYTETFDIKNGEKREILYALNPQTDAARELLKSVKSQRILERLAGIEVRKGADKIVESFPILNDLPINDKFYAIRPCTSRLYPQDTTKFAVCIELYNLSAEASAKKELTSRGYNLADYEIVVVDATFETQNNTFGE